MDGPTRAPWASSIPPPTAAPSAPSVAPLPPSMSKQITSQLSLKKFKKTPAYARITGALQQYAEAVVGMRLSAAPAAPSPAVPLIVEALERLQGWVAEVPPLQQAMRYGNKAFKTWHARVAEHAPTLMRQLLSGRVADEARAAALGAELATYFADAFGNATRIDYGTGHELSFFAWLLGLEEAGLLEAADRPAVVARVLGRYLLLMREVQTTYWLEPAGSHGVWGLDDYQFLPFLFGAAQLVGNDDIPPAAVHDERLLEAEHAEYLYLAAVRFVRQVKKGPFHEHSPYLNDISQLASWQRVVDGLVRMYDGEVLGKLPVVQHLPFGELLKWD